MESWTPAGVNSGEVSAPSDAGEAVREITFVNGHAFEKSVHGNVIFRSKLG